MSKPQPTNNPPKVQMNLSKVPPWSLYSSGKGNQAIQIPPVKHEENHGFTSQNVRNLALELMNDPELGTRSRVVNPLVAQGRKTPPAGSEAMMTDLSPRGQPNYYIMPS